MTEIIMKSERSILRSTKKDDITFVINTEYNNDNSPYIGQWTEEEHEKSLQDKDIIHLILEDAENNRVGYAILAGIISVNRSIELKRIVIVEKGKGYGREFLRLIKVFVFESLKAHRLWLDVREFNTRAQNVYKKEGFKEEGVLRECVIHEEQYISLIVMSILEDEYKGII